MPVELPLASAPVQRVPGKTVTLAILVRNSEGTLPFYLECLEKQTYPKSLISVFVRTNDNTDNTTAILTAWATKWKDSYARIELDQTSTQSTIPGVYESEEDRLNYANKWTRKKLTMMGRLREQTLEIARKWDTDFFFTADCDNFLVSSTLKYLVSLNKDFVGPMLRYPVEYEAHGDVEVWTNHFNAVQKSTEGFLFYAYSEFDEPIRERRLRGTMQVPVMQCSYLLSRRALKQVSYLADNGEFEFQVLARSAREAGILQYVDNTRRWGLAVYLDSSLTYIRKAMLVLEEENKQMEVSPPVYTQRVYAPFENLPRFTSTEAETAASLGVSTS